MTVLDPSYSKLYHIWPSCSDKDYQRRKIVWQIWALKYKIFKGKKSIFLMTWIFKRPCPRIQDVCLFTSFLFLHDFLSILVAWVYNFFCPSILPSFFREIWNIIPLVFFSFSKPFFSYSAFNFYVRSSNVVSLLVSDYSCKEECLKIAFAVLRPNSHSCIQYFFLHIPLSCRE